MQREEKETPLQKEKTKKKKKKNAKLTTHIKMENKNGPKIPFKTCLTLLIFSGPIYCSTSGNFLI